MYPKRPNEPLPDQATQDRLMAIVRAGNTVEVAVAALGIEAGVLQEWIRRGRTQGRGGAYRVFLQRLSQALAEAEARDVAMVSRAARDNWQAAAWRLERVAPDRWGKGPVERPPVPENPEPGEEYRAMADELDRLHGTTTLVVDVPALPRPRVRAARAS